jgi:hypothetical protein
VLGCIGPQFARKPVAVAVASRLGRQDTRYDVSDENSTHMTVTHCRWAATATSDGSNDDGSASPTASNMRVSTGLTVQDDGHVTTHAALDFSGSTVDSDRSALGHR